jgi:hypothetical protein
MSKNPSHTQKIRLVEWLKVKALNLSPSTEKKKTPMPANPPHKAVKLSIPASHQLPSPRTFHLDIAQKVRKRTPCSKQFKFQGT